MYNEVFKDFVLNCKVDGALISKYEDKLPEDIISIWKEYGFGTFMNGYFKIINPDEYVEVLEMSYYASDRAIPMIMTAFGDLIVWEDNRYIMMIKYKEKDIKCLSATMDWFWEDLSDEYYTNKFFELDIYSKAVEKAGRLAIDECFGYTPLLGLGGSKKIDNLSKVKIREHIEIITTMVGRIE